MCSQKTEEDAEPCAKGKSNKQISVINRKRIGEFLILLLYLIVDVLEIWPRSHLGALLIAFVGIIALALLDGEFSIGSITKSGSLIALMFLVIYVFATPILPEETEIHGWLLPANDPTPQTSCGNTGGFLVIAGRNAFVSTRPGKFLALAINSCTVICVDRGENGVLIDADIFDDKGILSAHIEKNEWRLIPGQYSYQKRPDRSTLIVYDRQGKELLKIRYLNPNAIRILGVFACKDSDPVTITDDRIILTRGYSRGSTVYGNCNFNAPIAIMTSRQPLSTTCEN